MYTLYVHTNLFNNKKYVGITSKSNVNERFLNGAGYKSNKEFWNDIQKYGWDSGFKHEILLKDLSVEEACKKEAEYIHKFNATNKNFGYNRDDGGNLNPAYKIHFFGINIFDWEDYKYYTSIYDASNDLNLPMFYISEKLTDENIIDYLLDIFDENKKDKYFFIKKSDAWTLFKFLREEKEWEWDRATNEEPQKITKEQLLLQILYYSLESIKHLLKPHIKYSANHIRLMRIDKDIRNLKQLNTDDLFFFFERISRFKNNKNIIFYEGLIKRKPKYYQNRLKKNSDIKYPEIFKGKRKKERIRIEKIYKDTIKKYGECKGIDLENFVIDFNIYNEYIDKMENCEGQSEVVVVTEHQ